MPSFNGSVTWALNGAYNPAGQLVGVERLATPQASCPSTVVPYYFNEDWQYNALNQLAEIDTSTQTSGYPAGSQNPGLATSFFAKYTYIGAANNGQITQATDSRLGYSINYGYDALKRLISAARSHEVLMPALAQDAQLLQSPAQLGKTYTIYLIPPSRVALTRLRVPSRQMPRQG